MSVVVDNMEKLTQEQLVRYEFTASLKEVGKEGQIKLLNSSVLIVGLGGLGSTVATVLTSMGVGHLGFVDFDVINPSNLPRQFLYGIKDIGKGKALTAKKHLRKKNPDVDIKTYPYRLDETNARRIITKYDLVIDCTDNFETKFLINDFCVKLKKSFVVAGVMDYQGEVMTVIPGKSADFKSLFSELPKSDPNEDKSVYPIAVSVVANIAASECIKYLLNFDNLLLDSMLVIDLLKTCFKLYKITK